MLTIVTPAYNAMPYIKACHDSIRSQTYSAWRWIVVDDASTDGTAEYLDSIAETDNRITVSHRTENSGNAKLPRDTGVTMAETERVMLIDADDTISPDYVATMMETMDRMESDIVYPRMHF
ncbi:MAG: glycosyltransferase family A protein, partial [Prevotella sp.]|nr:glycosyltransferase family A protein [Prevotella sp.]